MSLEWSAVLVADSDAGRKLHRCTSDLTIALSFSSQIDSVISTFDTRCIQIPRRHVDVHDAYPRLGIHQ